MLSPQHTIFIILSSDMDFRNHMQLLQNAGFHVVLIHQARNDKWKTTLEMHSSESFEWKCVMSEVDGTLQADSEANGDMTGSGNWGSGVELGLGLDDGRENGHIRKEGYPNPNPNPNP